MSDPLRTDSPHALDTASASDRDAKIEQLLLIGLDHYFAAEHEQAINVWTRALFLDRSHARARAYIERARSALAERQRESEELLQNGIAAFHRGEGEEARRLLQAAMSRGAPSDEALSVLDRLNRLEQGGTSPRQLPVAGIARRRVLPRITRRAARSSLRAFVWSAILLVAAAIVVMLTASNPSDLRSLVTLQPPQLGGAVAPAAGALGLPLPRRGETALVRARALAAGGHLRGALAALDLVRPTDGQRPDADRLRAEIQRQLIALSSTGPPRIRPGDGEPSR